MHGAGPPLPIQYANDALLLNPSCYWVILDFVKALRKCSRCGSCQWESHPVPPTTAATCQKSWSGIRRGHSALNKRFIFIILNLYTAKTTHQMLSIRLFQQYAHLNLKELVIRAEKIFKKSVKCLKSNNQPTVSNVSTIIWLNEYIHVFSVLPNQTV